MLYLYSIIYWENDEEKNFYVLSTAEKEEIEKHFAHLDPIVYVLDSDITREEVMAKIEEMVKQTFSDPIILENGDVLYLGKVIDLIAES